MIRINDVDILGIVQRHYKKAQYSAFELKDGTLTVTIDVSDLGDFNGLKQDLDTSTIPQGVIIAIRYPKSTADYESMWYTA